MKKPTGWKRLSDSEEEKIINKKFRFEDEVKAWRKEISGDEIIVGYTIRAIGIKKYEYGLIVMKNNIVKRDSPISESEKSARETAYDEMRAWEDKDFAKEGIDIEIKPKVKRDYNKKTLEKAKEKIKEIANKRYDDVKVVIRKSKKVQRKQTNTGRFNYWHSQAEGRMKFIITIFDYTSDIIRTLAHEIAHIDEHDHNTDRHKNLREEIKNYIGG